MATIDTAVVTFLNSFAGRSWTFDTLVAAMGTNYAVKTCPLLAVFCWAWFRSSRRPIDDRPTLIFGLAAACVAVAIARALSLALPFHERPLRNPTLGFVTPLGANNHAILGWSSFPSDNATLFFALAACLFLVSRRAGLFAYLHTTFIICLPRLYMGWHYPSDIAAGAALGIGCVLLIQVGSLKAAVVRAPMRWLNERPEIFLSALFLALFFIATTFEPLYFPAELVMACARAAMATLPASKRFVVTGAVLALLVVTPLAWHGLRRGHHSTPARRAQLR